MIPAILYKLKDIFIKIAKVATRYIVFIPVVKTLGICSNADMNGIINILTNKFNLDKDDIVVADTDYILLDSRTFELLHKEIITELKILHFKYEVNVFDCDNFAYLYACLSMLAAYRNGYQDNFAVGIAWSDKHAFNIVILADNTVKIIEPQNGYIYDEPPSDMYKPTKIFFLS